MLKTNPIAYLPIEYRSREFDGKLALAVALIRRGVTVVVGQQWLMYDKFSKLAPGVVLFKSQNKLHHLAMHSARRAGHIVLSLEEESMALTCKESIVRNCPPSTYEFVDYLLTTGEVERDAHIEAGCPTNKLLVSGNPRIDVLKPEFRNFHADDIARLRSSYGSFVLINTNFGIKNTKWGSIDFVRNIEIGAGSLNPNDPDSVRNFETMVAWEEENSQGIFSIVKSIAEKFKNRIIIVRPHPSEDLQKVVDQYSSFENVRVLHVGSHVAWTLASDILIHSSCTTGMEAAIAGKVSVSLVTAENWISRAFLTNRVNPVYRSVDALASDVNSFLVGDKQISMPSLTPFEPIIHNIRSVSSVEIIAKFMAGMMRPVASLNIARFETADRNPVLVEKCNISLQEITQLVDRLTLIPFLSVNSRPVIQQIGDSLFLMPAIGASSKAA
jgi:surface carbohydrate biosynthesis protein